MLYLYDLEGRELWRREQPPGAWAAACWNIDWMGGGQPHCILVYGRGHANPIVIYDGQGNIVDAFHPQFTPDRTEEDRRLGSSYCIRADVWGDSREEVIAFGSRCACIYANSRILAIPTLYNQNLYPGM
jgi:hypothetical protein